MVKVSINIPYMERLGIINVIFHSAKLTVVPEIENGGWETTLSFWGKKPIFKAFAVSLGRVTPVSPTHHTGWITVMFGIHPYRAQNYIHQLSVNNVSGLQRTLNVWWKKNG